MRQANNEVFTMKHKNSIINKLDEEFAEGLEKITVVELFGTCVEEDLLLEAQVSAVYTVEGIGYSGLLKDKTGTIPFMCETKNYKSDERALVPLMLYDSLKTKTVLKLCINTTTRDSGIIDIKKLSGLCAGMYYTINDDK
jgi:hypothetical protein